MSKRYVFRLSEYVDRAMAQAAFDKLEDHGFFGRIPSCRGLWHLARRSNREPVGAL